MNLNVFNFITGTNESKILTKDRSCKCECNFDGRKCSSNQKWNNHKRRCKCKNPKEHNLSEKDYICNPPACRCKNGKYAGSITADSVITRDEIIDGTKST